jgi:Spy/CpxP family protein refolding chaperone
MKRLLPACLLLISPLALAQHSSDYAGHQRRDIKALSAEEIRQYQSGAGMSFALAAELNRYPGPLHVLELADPLKLTGAQRDAVQALMDSHKAEARAIGARLVEAERELDAMFAGGKATPAELRSKVQAAGQLRSDYRISHLETHLRTRELLTAEQVQRYDHLRGYAGGHAQDRHKHVR